MQTELPLEFFDLVECGANLNHHLRQKPSGLWQLRITVDRGSKYVGKRVIIGLNTKCVREARVRRDLILQFQNKINRMSSETNARLDGAA